MAFAFQKTDSTSLLTLQTVKLQCSLIQSNVPSYFDRTLTFV